MRGEVRDRDVDRRDRAGAGDEPKLTQLLGRLEAVATLHLDRRRAELRGVADAALQEREEHLVARLAGRPDGSVNASAGRQHREVIGAAAARRELFPPLSRVAEMGVRVDEAGHDDAAKDVAVDHALDQLDEPVRVPVAGRDDRAIPRRHPPVREDADISGRGPDPRTLLFQRGEREKAGSAEEQVRLEASGRGGTWRLGHSRKWVSITRSRVKPSSLSASAAT